MNARKDEALATLQEESTVLEPFFLDSTEHGDYLIGYLRAESLAQAAEAVKGSVHAIDAAHKQFQQDTWESGQGLELLLDLSRLEMET